MNDRIAMCNSAFNFKSCDYGANDEDSGEIDGNIESKED